MGPGSSNRACKLVAPGAAIKVPDNSLNKISSVFSGVVFDETPPPARYDGSMDSRSVWLDGVLHGDNHSHLHPMSLIFKI